jgi:hypothetical protein
MSWIEHFDMKQKLSMHDCTLHLLHLNHGPNTYVVPIKLERPFFSLPEEFSLTPATTHSSRNKVKGRIVLGTNTEKDYFKNNPVFGPLFQSEIIFHP